MHLKRIYSPMMTLAYRSALEYSGGRLFFSYWVPLYNIIIRNDQAVDVSDAPEEDQTIRVMISTEWIDDALQLLNVRRESERLREKEYLCLKSFGSHQPRLW